VRNEVRVVPGALAGLYKGDWACGLASWPRNPATCASADAPVHGERGEGGTDKAGPRHRERGQGRAGNGSTTGNPGPRDRERRRARGQRKTGADRLAPAGRERKRERERGRGELPLIGGVRMLGSAGARARGLARLSGPNGLLSLFLFSGFSNSFSISFSIGFSNPKSN
jgi:hypothetical protein